MLKTPQDELPLQQEPGWNDLELHDHYARIPNQLLTVIASSGMSASMMRIVIMVARYTFGYSRNFTSVTREQLADDMGIRERTVRKAIQDAVNAGVIIRRGRLLGIETDYSKWDCGRSRPSRIEKQVRYGMSIAVLDCEEAKPAPSVAPQRTNPKPAPSVAAYTAPSVADRGAPSVAPSKERYKQQDSNAKANASYAKYVSTKSNGNNNGTGTAITTSPCQNDLHQSDDAETTDAATVEQPEEEPTPMTHSEVWGPPYWFEEIEEWVDFDPEQLTVQQKEAHIRATFAGQFGGRPGRDPIEEELKVLRKMERDRNGKPASHARIPDYDVCPECGGELIPRDGKWGWWLGCSCYPECRYTMRLAI